MSNKITWTAIMAFLFSLLIYTFVVGQNNARAQVTLGNEIYKYVEHQIKTKNFDKDEIEIYKGCEIRYSVEDLGVIKNPVVTHIYNIKDKISSQIFLVEVLQSDDRANHYTGLINQLSLEDGIITCLKAKMFFLDNNHIWRIANKLELNGDTDLFIKDNNNSLRVKVIKFDHEMNVGDMKLIYDNNYLLLKETRGSSLTVIDEGIEKILDDKNREIKLNSYPSELIMKNSIETSSKNINVKAKSNGKVILSKNFTKSK